MLHMQESKINAQKTKAEIMLEIIEGGREVLKLSWRAGQVLLWGSRRGITGQRVGTWSVY